MGLFGGGRKAAERAEQAERDRQRDAVNAEVKKLQESGVQEMDAWLNRLQTMRSPESLTLTDDLLVAAGPVPFPQLAPGFPDHGVIMVRATVRAYGAASANHRKIDAFNAGDRNLSAFWESVGTYTDSQRTH